MSFATELFIKRAKDECAWHIKRSDYIKTRQVIESIKRQTCDFWPQAYNQVTDDWRSLICCWGSLMTKTSKDGEVLYMFKDLVAAGGLLAKDPGSHNVYAKALSKKHPDKAIKYLLDYMRPGELLASQDSSHNTLAAIYNQEHLHQKAIDHILLLIEEGGVLEENKIAYIELGIAFNASGQPQGTVKYLGPNLRDGKFLCNCEKADSLYQEALDLFGLSQLAVEESRPEQALNGLRHTPQYIPQT